MQAVEEVHFVVYSPTERVERISGKVEPLEFYAMCWRRHNKASLARPCRLLAGFGLVRMMMMVLGAMTAVYNFTDGLRFHFRSVILLLCSSFAKNISFFLAFLSFVTLCPFRISLWTYLIFAMFFFQFLHILLYSVDDPMSIRLISECINTA